MTSKNDIHTAEVQSTPTDKGNLAVLAALAADHAVIAHEPIHFGDHGILVRHPDDWVAETIDARHFEDHLRERIGDRRFSTVESLVRYVNRYKTVETLGYFHDISGRGAKVLANDWTAGEYVIDDWSNDDEDKIANRNHKATLVLRPTAAARRWANALDTPLDQMQMVELVIDGAGEIAAPDAADLRDLISDLHAIRNSTAKSVIRVDGGMAVEVTENVSLHAGTGNTLQVPETLTILLRPWTAVDATITFTVKVRPKVVGDTVKFVLAAPHVEERLTTVLDAIHHELADDTTGTGIAPFWTI